MGTLSDFHQDVESVALRLVADYREALMAEAVSLCGGDLATAEDLVFRTLEVLFRRGGPGESYHGPILPWLRGVMRRIHHDATRGKARAAVVYLDPETLALVSDARAGEAEGDAPAAPAPPAPDMAASAREDADAVRAAVESLSPRMREIIVLHYFEGVPVARMASVLRISQDAVKCRLYYARKVLARRLCKTMRGPAAKVLLIALALAALTGIGAMVYGTLKSRGPQEGDSESVAAISEEQTDEASSAFPHRFFTDPVPYGFSLLPSSQNSTPPMNRPIILSAAAAAYALATPAAPALPSATLLDYVESTGTQYIDTGVTGKTGTRMVAEMEWVETPSSQSTFCGAYDGNTYVVTPYTSAGSSHQVGYAKNTQYQVGGSGKPTPNIRFRVETTLEADSQSFNVRSLDGSGYNATRTYNDAASVNLGHSLYLFARNDAGTANQYSSARVFSLMLWQKDNNGDWQLVRHFLPCVSNGLAALYDKEHGTIYYPQGGELVAGPELPRPRELVEWVQSDGADGDRRLYVDTGVPAKAGTGMTAELLWPTKPESSSVFCGAMSSDSKYFTLYVGNETHRMGYETWSEAQIQGGGNAAKAGVRYCISSFLTAGSQYLNAKALDGSNYDGTRTYNTAATNDTAQTLYLFARNDAGTPNQFAHVRFYALVLTNEIGVVRDFLPCVADNGKAGLYDRVSERVFFPKAAVGGATAEFSLATEIGAVTNLPASTKWPKSRPEYIQANGTNDYVNLGVMARDGTRMLAEVEWNALPTAATFCGSATNSSAGLFTTYRVTPDFHRIGYYNGSKTLGGASCTPVAKVRYRVETSLANGTQTFSVARQKDGAWVPVGKGNDTFDLSFPAGYADLGLPLYLFARNFNGVPDEFAPARLYSFKLWQGVTLVRDLHPVFDPADNAPALFDKVEKKYYRNDGGYRLTAGGETTPFPGETTLLEIR